jgi:hypothetical protein
MSRNWRNARNDFNEVLKIEPNSGIARHNLGLSQARDGEWDSALFNFSKAVEVEPMAVTYRARGDIYLEQGELAKAREDYESALILDPEMNEMLLGQSTIRFLEGDLKSTVQFARTFLEREPEATNVYGLQAWINKVENESNGIPVLDLTEIRLSPSDIPINSTVCPTQELADQFKRSFDDQVDNYVTSFCVSNDFVVVIGHTTRVAMPIEQANFDERMEEFNKDFRSTKNTQLLTDELDHGADSVHAWREKTIIEGKNVLLDYIIFRRGIMSVQLSIVYSETSVDILVKDAIFANYVLEEMDRKIILGLLEIQPYEAAILDIRNIPPLLFK